MRVLIAPDKFKGTLSAELAADAMREAVMDLHPEWEVELLPMADGGEGTAEMLTLGSGGAMYKVSASDPLFRQVSCEMGFSADGSTAFIDSAEAAGLHRLAPAERNPMRTSSRGVGEMMMHAIQRRVKRIVVGLGGTATMDAGTGILQALGVTMLNEDSRNLMPTGGNLGKIEYLNADGFALKHSKIEIIFLHDVALPLLDESYMGGVMMFGEQKGLKEEDRPILHAAFGNFRNLMESTYKGQPKLPGMGAAGGAAFALACLYPVRLEPGAAWVAQAIGMEKAIHEADLILTGEGRLDATTPDGKCVFVIAEMALRQGKRVVAVVGKNALSPAQSEEMGIQRVQPILPDDAEVQFDRASAFLALKETTKAALIEERLKLC